jgi:DNA-binding PadR family transcriptional regulator
MSAARLSNPLALAVLTLLDERPMHPYEMSTTLRERHKEDSIKLNYGSLYSVVASLQKYGLIEAQETLREGNRPERTVYAITEPGKVKMTDWLSELISVPTRQFTSFEAALSLMPALPPAAVVRLLEIRLATLQGQYHSAQAMLTQVPPGFPRIFLVESEFQQTLLDAELHFVRTLLHDLTTDGLTGLDGWRRLHELKATDATPEQIAKLLAAEFPTDPWEADPTTP